MSLLRATMNPGVPVLVDDVSLNSLCNWKGPQSSFYLVLQSYFLVVFYQGILVEVLDDSDYVTQACRIDVHEIPKLMCSSELLESCRTGRGRQKVKS